MDFKPPDEHQQIRDAIERICGPFDADYGLRRDRDGGFPDDFHPVLAQSGWLGIAMPPDYGDAGYARQYHVERYLREAWIPRLTPVSPQLILCYVAEKVLGLPRSY